MSCARKVRLLTKFCFPCRLNTFTDIWFALETLYVYLSIRAASDHALDDPYDSMESFRFTVADNPGLIEDASANVGLGHSFLRSIERSHALAYVVDLSTPAPWDEVQVLREELEKYKPVIAYWCMRYCPQSPIHLY